MPDSAPMSTKDFREFVPRAGHARWGDVDMGKHDIYSWADFALQNPLLREMWEEWQRLYAEPYKGVTIDGHPQKDLFHLRAEGAPTEAMKKAAVSLVNTAEQTGVGHKMRRAVDAPEWRCWSNPEIYFAQAGIRLEEVAESVKTAVLELARCSVSPRGYEKVVACMRINHFLGELSNVRHLMNENSYNFILFGEPSLTDPWGWSLWGHHLTLCVFVLGTQMVISPIFFGCEPNRIDAGPYSGTSLMESEMVLATRLLNSLSPDQKALAVAYDALEHPDMPEGFPHPADGRNIVGAYQDNKVLPYSGVCASTFSHESKRMVLDLVERLVDVLPQPSLEAKLSDVEKHIQSTWLLWMGTAGDSDVFHFRIHSPVILCEFDHECGMWLNNPHPARFHIHTIIRTPNGNDYGKELLRLWRRRTQDN